MAEITRLYQKFQPSHYNLFIDVERETKKISGTSTITGDAKTTDIQVNEKGMKIASVKADGQDVPFTNDDEAEAINITLPKTGEVTVAIEYSAPLTDSMMGIYPSYYELNGEKKQIIGTQFETTAARQAFPSVDEPEAKATFDLALKFDEQPGETVLANMPEVRNENGVHYFDTTVRMSTYLIAFAFGDLQGKQTTTKSGVKVGVFSTKAHKPSELDFSLDIAKRAIEFYEDFYQTPYPLPHSWQLALPDFSAGAMENWGLVTYREFALLLDPDNTSLRMKQYVATVVTHELAHQWFGDLVTMKWWDDLWLNESFANMMEYVAVDALEPDWHVWEMFQTVDVPGALNRDATDGVQPVHVQVNNPAEIDSLFDPYIVYAKGARMLVMVRALLGDDNLRAGLKAYFAAHHYGNATGADLWAALGQASGMDVGAIMNSWLEQPGYPVVNASVVDGKLTLSQKQFFIGDGKDAGRQWQIPLNGSFKETPTIMKDATITLGDYAELRQANGKPFRLNVGNNSHFIVEYDDTLMQDILAHKADLNAIDELQLLQDMRMLADGRQLSYAAIVPLLPQFADSQSTIVTTALYEVAGSLRKFTLPDTDEEATLRQLYGKLSAKQVARLGWTAKAGESNDDQITRPSVLGAAVFAKNEDAIADAHKLYLANADKLESFDATIRPIVLDSEMLNFGNEALFDKFLTAYKQTPDASYKSALQSAITATKDVALVKKTIAQLENADVIKPQDMRGWYFALLRNSKGQQAAWDWIRNDWDWLEKTVGGDMEFATYITRTSDVFKTPERLAEFKAFFEPKLNTPGLTREIQMDIKIIESRVALVEAEKAKVNAAVAEAVK